MRAFIFLEIRLSLKYYSNFKELCAFEKRLQFYGPNQEEPESIEERFLRIKN